MTASFPIQLTPHPEESLPSLLRRLSAATAIPIKELFDGSLCELLLHRSHWWSPPHPVLAELLGLSPEEMLEHMLGGRQIWIDNCPQADTYRDPLPQICPSCGTTSIWAHLVLVTSCHRCGLLFTDDSRVTVAPTAEAMDLQRTYLGTITNQGADVQRIRRLWRLIDLDRCAPWLGPAAASTYPASRGKTQVEGPIDRRSPAWISAFAVHAWPATQTPATFYGHIVRMLLARSAPSRGATDPATAERSHLHAELRRLGLTLATMPWVVMDCYQPGYAQCHLEEIGYAVSAALRLELDHALTGRHHPLWEETRPREVWPKIGINGLVDHLRDTADGRRLLLHEAERIAANGPVDYRRRAETLEVLHAVRGDILTRAGLPRATPNRPKSKDITRVAAAWIWLELVRGALGNRTHYAALRKDVQRFDAQLAPEARLALLEHGHELLAAVETDTTIAHRPIRRGEKRTRDVG